MIPLTPLERIFVASTYDWSLEKVLKRSNVESSIDGILCEAQIVNTLYAIPFIADVQNCCADKEEER